VIVGEAAAGPGQCGPGRLPRLHANSASILVGHGGGRGWVVLDGLPAFLPCGEERARVAFWALDFQS